MKWVFRTHQQIPFEFAAALSNYEILQKLAIAVELNRKRNIFNRQMFYRIKLRRNESLTTAQLFSDCNLLRCYGNSLMDRQMRPGSRSSPNTGNANKKSNAVKAFRLKIVEKLAKHATLK